MTLVRWKIAETVLSKVSVALATLLTGRITLLQTIRTEYATLPVLLDTMVLRFLGLPQ